MYVSGNPGLIDLRFAGYAKPLQRNIPFGTAILPGSGRDRLPALSITLDTMQEGEAEPETEMETQVEAFAEFGLFIDREEYGDDLKVFKSEYKSMKFTLAGRDERSLIKMLVDGKTDKVIGAHMIGPDSAEIIQGIAVALKCGATKAQFDDTVAVHPSSAEEFVLMK